MEENGTVQSVKDNKATIRIMRTSACGHCEMCGLTSEKKFVDIDLDNTLGAKVGDVVQLSMTGANVVKVSMIIYLIPLALGLVGLMIAYLCKGADWIQIVSSLLGVALGFVFVKMIDKKYSSKMNLNPTMVKILSKEKE